MKTVFEPVARSCRTLTITFSDGHFDKLNDRMYRTYWAPPTLFGDGYQTLNFPTASERTSIEAAV